jgi:transcriptional regulator with XRE-family HTH domain
MSFGTRLKQARDRAGLTQQQLQIHSGVSQKTISKIERGDQTVSTAGVQLAQACGVRPEWLVAGEEPMLPGAAHAIEQIRAVYAALSKDAVEIAKQWQDLPKKQRDRLREQLSVETAAAKVRRRQGVAANVVKRRAKFEKRSRRR